MLVKNWMSHPPITIDQNSSMQDATKLLKQHHIHMLPVTKKDKLAGILTDRDLKEASASDATTLEIHELLYLLANIKVKDIMTRDPITVPDDYTIEETAEILLDNKISGVPVMDRDGQLAGVITQSDLFKSLIALTGVGKKGLHFAFQLEDRPGSIKEITDILRGYEGRMASILSTYDGVPEGMRNVYIRVFGIDRDAMPRLKAELRERGKLLYMVDHLENHREIY